jgi:hypothetical protein
MNASADLTWMFRMVISILLSLVIYFVRLLHVDLEGCKKILPSLRRLRSSLRANSKVVWS